MEKRRGSSEMGMLCSLGFGLALSPDLASNFGLDFYTDEIQGGKRHGDLLALIHLKKNADGLLATATTAAGTKPLW